MNSALAFAAGAVAGYLVVDLWRPVGCKSQSAPSGLRGVLARVLERKILDAVPPSIRATKAMKDAARAAASGAARTLDGADVIELAKVLGSA